ncbi:MgtC/SapB family protein [Saccharospirillum salsuginis]|uniref:Membrane protein n=1 Tax=Saccharospirillum salsuginis TaxID=418750 RepID=A0A918N8B4_9GAMM|nr:MgtC/SapB family protein [Saccharospirillum salsuginis]GGX46168.1 membrane protein [Saccharospirillum salsuginis]
MDALTNDLITNNTTLFHLALALLLGALIGLQRGWQARDREAGSRVAGIRTHALVGLLGGFAALLSQEVTVWVLPVAFLVVAGLALMGYRMQAMEFRDFSITGMIGLMLTFSFGAAVMVMDPALPSAAAVITTLILDNKQSLHTLVKKLEAHELDAGLKLLLITVVLLPILPDQGFGPGGVLNPYEIWWLVVLIASVSFVGYFAMRVGGTEKGLLFTSLFAGLSSSTALTLHFSQLSKRTPGLNPLLAAGILIACGTMFPRILVYCALINPDLLADISLPVVLMATLLYAPAIIIWRRHRADTRVENPKLHQNPLDLKSALLFGALLTAILLLGTWLKDWLGDAGIYLLAATSGITDVDAITLSLTRLSNDSLAMSTATLGIIIAASVNNLVKALMAAGIGSRSLGLRVGIPMSLSLVIGLGAALLT